MISPLFNNFEKNFLRRIFYLSKFRERRVKWASFWKHWFKWIIWADEIFSVEKSPNLFCQCSFWIFAKFTDLKFRSRLFKEVSVWRLFFKRLNPASFRLQLINSMYIPDKIYLPIKIQRKIFKRGESLCICFFTTIVEPGSCEIFASIQSISRGSSSITYEEKSKETFCKQSRAWRPFMRELYPSIVIFLFLFN